MASISAMDRNLLRALVPLSSLSNENFAELLRKVSVEEMPAGRTLFRAEDAPKFTYYLVEGTVELQGASSSRELCSNQSEANHPLTKQQPPADSAITKTDVRYLRIDNDLLDVLLTWDQSSGYVVSDLQENEGDDGDWMVSMLQSSIFQQVPPANLQQLFTRLEAFPAQPGQVVVRQGDPGDYYYIIRKGRARVSRCGPSGAELKLADLETGSGFGEEALLTDCERNATVTMLTDGMLMRLSKQDFDELLKAPALYEVGLEEGVRMVSEGAQWLDVRLESEYQQDAIDGSLNIPLFLLRLRLRELDAEKTYIVYCDSGARSSAAAYILGSKGFEVYLLSGGKRAASDAA